MSQFVFEGTAKWKSESESDIVVKGKHVATISPPPEFGGKKGYFVQCLFTMIDHARTQKIEKYIPTNLKYNQFDNILQKGQV